MDQRCCKIMIFDQLIWDQCFDLDLVLILDHFLEAWSWSDLLQNWSNFDRSIWVWPLDKLAENLDARPVTHPSFEPFVCKCNVSFIWAERLQLLMFLWSWTVRGLGPLSINWPTQKNKVWFSNWFYDMLFTVAQGCGSTCLKGTKFVRVRTFSVVNTLSGLWMVLFKRKYFSKIQLMSVAKIKEASY